MLNQTLETGQARGDCTQSQGLELDENLSR